MKTTRVWINYDLGIQGDYTGLYTWLDGKDARECGDRAASFLLELDDDEDAFAALRDELEEAVELSARARIYVLRVHGGKVTGRFVVGKRKRARWEGYAASDDSEDDVIDASV